MLEAIINIITHPAFTAMIGFIIGHFWAIGRDKRKEFNEAADIFRDAFLIETTFLKHNANIGGLGGTNDLGDILGAGYLRHLKAFEVFMNYLTTNERTGINKAWQEYCHNPNKPDGPSFEQYSAKMTRKSEKELKTLARERIEKILKFAKRK